MSSHLDFTCKDCGSHELRVVWHEDRKFYCKEELVCFDDCSSAGELAAIKEYQRIDAYECWGSLDVDHHFPQEQEEFIETFYEDEQIQIFCEDCHKDADQVQWHFDEELDDDDIEVEYFVHCDGCDREVEFGWSHPNREGRIWPVESKDFNPWKSWPEPRFRKSWEKRNWIRPDR
jgi:hypothetical protein